MDLSEEITILDSWRDHVARGAPPPPTLIDDVDALFGDAQARVYRACRRIVGNDEQARDLAQDAMLTGYRKLHTFRGEGRLSTWLYGIAKMTALNAVRRRSELLSEDGLLEGDATAAEQLRRLRKEEREAVFREVASTLSELEQEAIHLRYVEGLPQDRITEILGIETASGARGVLQRCRRHLTRGLRARLEDLGHGSSFFRVST